MFSAAFLRDTSDLAEGTMPGEVKGHDFFCGGCRCGVSPE